MKVSVGVQNKIFEIRIAANMAIEKEILTYAKSKNKINVGDVITDHLHTIKVEEMKILKSKESMSFGFIYKGVELTKKGEPTKRQSDPFIYERNIEFLNNKPYERI